MIANWAEALRILKIASSMITYSALSSGPCGPTSNIIFCFTFYGTCAYFLKHLLHQALCAVESLSQDQSGLSLTAVEAKVLRIGQATEISE